MIAHQLTPEPTFTEACEWLIHSMTGDPVLLLVAAYAWLDPVLLENPSEDWDMDFESGIEAAMVNTRRFATHLYVDFVQWRRDIATQAKLYDAINAAIADYTGTESVFDTLDYMIGGYVPYECLGVDITNEDQLDQYERLQPLVTLIGDDQAAHWTARALMKSLASTGDVIHYNISILLEWLYGHTGNTLFDWDEYSFSEGGVEPMRWDDVEWSLTVQQEAHDLHSEAMAGLNALEADEWLWYALKCNTRYVRTLIESEAKYDDSFRVDLCWPEYIGDYRAGISDTQHDLSILPFRPGPEERPDRVSS